VKFRTEHVAAARPPAPRGGRDDDDDDAAAAAAAIGEDEWRPLAAALRLSEELGAAPVLPDGRVGGNGAVLSKDGASVVVSRSGREAAAPFAEEHFVRILDFDAVRWRAVCTGPDPTAEPSSDAPLLWHALKVAPARYRWRGRPRLVLHGHACATEEEAAARGIPCSARETPFSTPDDLDALMDLLRRYPYPENQLWIRKNHGFFLLAESEEEACRLFRTRLAAPHVNGPESARGKSARENR
jgi:hypothetical protein